MVKKILLKDFDGNELLPITRGELILDPSGKMALRSTLYLATYTLPGLMSPEDKYKIDNMSASSVAHDLILKIKSGTVEGTDLYTFNGSADKILDFQQGSGITLLPEANKMTISNSGVRAISESNVNGTISVNTNGTVANVSIKGLGSAAFTASSVYSVRLQLINEDLNNIITPGFYNAGSGNSVTNKPSNIDNFGLIVIHSATDSHYILLLFKEEVVWRRHCISGEWSIWKKDECYNVVSSTSNGLTPMIGTESASTIGSQSNEWVLASTSGATPTWRKLPSNAFNNTTYTLSGALSAGGFTTTLTSSTGSTSTSTVPIMGGATSSASGSVGLVPTPSSNTAFLRGDGTWTTPLDTHYTTHLYIGAINSASNSSTTNGNTYIKLFDNSTLRHLYKITGGGVTTVNSDSDGNLTISSSVKWSDISDKPPTFTPSTHNHPSSQITSLTGYSKATSPSNLSTTDTLNSALGKLEYKSNLTYDWYLSITQEDTDDIINKWGEIVDFIDSVAEGTDITDEFVTRKTALTIIGAKSFSTVVNITGTSNFSEGIRLHHYSDLSSLWFGAVNNSGYDPGMWGITVNSNGMRFRGTSSTTGTSASDYVNIIHGGNVGIGTTNPSHKLQVNGNISASKFIGTLNSTLTFSAGTFAAKTYDNSAAVTVNIPTHTSHLINNSGFLTQHQSLANYVTLNTAQTITGAKTFSNNLTLTSNLWFGAGNTDKYITFTSATTGTDASHSWRIGYIGTGSGDGNHFVLLSTKNTTNTWSTALSITNEGHVASFTGQVIANKFITNGGTSSQFVKGDGSLDSNTYATTTLLGNYLPLSGGTISGTLHIKRDASAIHYLSTNGTDLGWLGFNGKNLPFVWMADGVTGYTLLHSGNYNSYSPTLTGGGASGTWGINITGSAGFATQSNNTRYLQCPDTRSTDIIPSSYSAGLSADFKSNSITGLTAAYSGVITFRPYQSGSDWSGGPIHNLAFDTNGIHHRTASSDTWGNWKTLAYTSDIPTVTNYYWADLKISSSSNAATSPTVALLKATSGVQIGSTADYGWYLYNSRICAGINVDRGVNVGSLLVSRAWADSSKVPTNGIYSKGNITTPGVVKTGDLVITSTTADKHILFSRGSDTNYPYNYIAAPAGGLICILPNGVDATSDNGMQFSSSGLHPATNVAYSLGTSSLKWNAVYATNFHGALKGNADSASKLTTVSKTAWGLTYWTSGGVPTSISGNMTGVGAINMTGDIYITAGDTDHFLMFDYDADRNAGASWRVGMLGSGSGNTNYFVIESGTSDPSSTVWNRVLQLGQNSFEAVFASTVTSSGFIKSNSSDSYVLLGGGGHKTIASFQTTYDSRYVKKAGDTMTGTLTMNTGTGILMKYTSSSTTGDVWMYPNGASSYGIRYFEGTPDKMAISASGNNDSTSKADLCINGNGDGTVTIRGNNIWHAGNDGSGSGLDADLLDGLHIHTGRNSEANKVVRTDANGYILAGWINTTSGAFTGTPSRIYASDDAYIRYMTPANFFPTLTNDDDLLSITVGGLNRKLTIAHATNSDKLRVVSCYNGTTNNDLWSTIKTSDSSYLGTSTMYEVYNDGGPTTYGHILDTVSVHGKHWQSQLWMASGKTGRLYYRNKDYNDDTWGGWRPVAWTSDIPNPANYYWANIKVSASSSTSTSPTFQECYANGWFRSTGNNGWYNPTHNSHIHPNATTTYGNLVVRGAKSDYTGINLGNSTSHMTIMSTAAHHGLYCEADGVWEFYYNKSSSGVGIRTSTITKNFNVNGQSYLSSNTWIGTTSGGEMLNVGGWIGTVGSTGWYSVTHKGGWYMTDSTYIRVYGSKRVYNDNTSQYAFYTAGGMTALEHMYSNSSPSTWIGGQNATNAALNIGDATDTNSYWPWMRQTNKGSSKWFSMGVLNNCLYFIGSDTSRTDNSYDHGFRMDFSNGYLYGNFSGYLSGTASSASKLGSSTVGGTYQPIYLSSGTATAGTSYAKAIKAITRSGTTFTYTCIDGTTGTFTLLDNNTTYNFSGVSFTSGSSNTGTHDCNSITSNGVWYYTANGPTTTLGASTTDGALYSQAYSSSWVAQIAQDYRDGDLFTRGRNNGTWTAWKRVAYFSEITKANVGLGNVQNTAFYPRSTTINGTAWGMAGTNNAAAFTIYAPTTVGTSGYVLKSNGSGAPSWVALSTLSVGYSSSTGTLGKADVGSATQPIYLDSGAPKACTAYASASVNYANSAAVASKVSGTLKFVGGAFATATYNGSGNVSVNIPTSTSHLTNDNNFVHRSDSTSAVGGLARPVYVTSAGLVYACSYSLAANVNSGVASKLAYYSDAGNIDDYASNVGSATKPMYLSAGIPTACTYSLSATVNSGTSGKLAYYSGTNAISSYAIGVGNSYTPVYIKAGVPTAISITASTSTLYVLGTITGGTIYKGGTSTTTGVHITSGTVLNAPGGFYETSDARLKNFISDINIDFDKLRAIPKKYFTWKNKNKVNIGTSALELLKIYPEIVNEGEDGILTVAYDKLSIIALKAIDLLYDEILKLRLRIKTLEENK